MLSSSKSTILAILIELCYFYSDSYNDYNYTDSEKVYNELIMSKYLKINNFKNIISKLVFANSINHMSGILHGICTDHVWVSHKCSVSYIFNYYSFTNLIHLMMYYSE